MTQMVEVVIDSIRVSLTNQQRIIILKEAGHDRYLPIWIGPYEAESITISLQEVEIARPQTHDLIKNVLNLLDAHLLRVEVIAIKEDVFFGNLVLEVNGNIINVDSRPSDALALAVRTHVPILVAKEIMDSDGIIPEPEIEEDGAEGAEAPQESSSVEENPSEERLSVFEDFLQNLDINNSPDSPDEGG